MLTIQTASCKRLFALAAGLPLAIVTTAPTFAAPVDSVKFKLYPNQPFLACMAASPSVTPTVDAVVTRGQLNDTMTLTLKNFKPGLKFDLFTIQRTNQLKNGSPVPNFKNFGLAWYQSDLEGSATPNRTTIKTILLDQIFGFDPDVNLPPTNTFHVGFWFNNPADAEPCGFAGPPTPFNGEHKAGPLAFITRSVAGTGLGPLCTNPVSPATKPPTCNP